jgi:hypothetical protein
LLIARRSCHMQVIMDANQDIAVRVAAAINFKNHIKYSWVSANVVCCRSNCLEPGILYTSVHYCRRPQMLMCTEEQ